MIQSESWYWNIIREVMAIFDVMVYGYLKPVVTGFFDILNISTNQNLFTGIYLKVYIILGIFMAFKISFSFFRYLVNPDLMAEKNKGVGKLFIRVITMILALMFLPTLLFTGIDGKGGLLPRAEKAIIPLVPKLILGGSGYSSLTSADVDAKADTLALSTLSAFFYAPEALKDHCFRDLDPELKSVNDLKIKATKVCEFNSFTITPEIKEQATGGYKFYSFTYIFVISTATGIMLVGLFVAITLDIAKRIFKLIVLQIMAPIPIMSLIDPAVNYGDTAFSKWVKNLTSTFIDIFIKSALVYLVLVFVDKLALSFNGLGKEGEILFTNLPTDPTRKSYIIIILILGLVFFAKQAPKFIKESLGMKPDKGGLFDDVKSIAKLSAGVSAAGLGASAAVARNTIGTIGATSAAIRNRNTGFEKFTGAAGALLGGLTFGTLRSAGMGALEGKKAMGKGQNSLNGILGGWKGQQQRNLDKIANAATGSSFIGRTTEKMRKTFTGYTSGEREKREAELNKKVGETFKGFDEFADKQASDFEYTNNGRQATYGELCKAVETNDSVWASRHGYASIAEAAAHKKKVGKEAKNAAINKLITDHQTLPQNLDAVNEALNSGDYSALSSLGITDHDGAVQYREDILKNISDYNELSDHVSAYNSDLKAAGLDTVDIENDLANTMKDRSDAAALNTQRTQAGTTRVQHRSKSEKHAANSDAINRKKGK